MSVTCRVCNGSGITALHAACPHCGGWGYLPDRDSADDAPPADWSHLAAFCGVVAAIALVVGFVVWAFSVAGV